MLRLSRRFLLVTTPYRHFHNCNCSFFRGGKNYQKYRQYSQSHPSSTSTRITSRILDRVQTFWKDYIGTKNSNHNSNKGEGNTMGNDLDIDHIADDFAEGLRIGDDETDNNQKNKQNKEEEEGLQKIANWIQTKKVQNVLVLCGAGVSVAAGIPDFRTPGTGLYDNLQKYSLPFPEAIFDVGFYRKKPEAFGQLAQELWPGLAHSPTLTHSFLKLLSDKGILLRLYSQNIDGLEHLAGLPNEELVECHGHFRTASCIDCRKAADGDQVKKVMVEDKAIPICTKCGGYVKPDIVFFGENLPQRFHTLIKQDVKKADLMLVLGTSLQVAPVSAIPDMVNCPRVLFNRDLVMPRMKKQDVFVEGDCDATVTRLCKFLGWKEKLLSQNEKTQIVVAEEAQEDNATTTTDPKK